MVISPDSPEPRPPPADGAADEGLAFDLESLWRIVEAEDADVAPADPFVGSVVGGARLLRVIGEGGMGRVYEALQDQPRRVVAVKLQRPGRLERESTRRFLRELELLGRLSHPALCHVYGAGFHEWGGERLPYFLMEYVPDALPVTAFAAAHRLPLRRRLELFRDVCAGVAVAHGAGIVHRDLKASNVIVGAEGAPKVIDFGVAAAFRGDLHATSLTRSGKLVGTLSATAPELLASGHPKEDPRSDVWALGVVLHELVLGEPPFRIDAGSVASAIDSIRTHRSALSARGRPPLGRALGDVVDTALARDPSRRFPDAGVLATSLAAILARFAPDHPAWAGGADALFPVGGVHRRRLRWAGIGALALAAGLVLWLGAAAWRGGDGAGGATGPQASVDADAEAVAGWMSSIPSPDFRYFLRHVFEPDADTHLVEISGLRKWREPFPPFATYWAPEDRDVEGIGVWRFDFPRPSRRVYLQAALGAWDGTDKRGGVVGRGAWALEWSRDGVEWHAMADHLSPRAYGVSTAFDGLLPDASTGSTSLWLRVRIVVEEGWANGSYSAAQFMRSTDDAAEPIFGVVVECEPPEGRPEPPAN